MKKVVVKVTKKYGKRSRYITSWILQLRKTDYATLKGTKPPLKKSLNIPEIYAKMFGGFH